MSLDLTLYYDVPDAPDDFDCEAGSFNITHNLGKMASEVGVYELLWRPKETFGDDVRAKDLVPRLRSGIKMLEAGPDGFRKYDAPNGWGTYAHFLSFVREVLAACEEHPDARVRSWV